MKVEVSTASLRVLDWAVAKLEGLISGNEPMGLPNQDYGFKPTTNPVQGHPIIERKRINLEASNDGETWAAAMTCTPEFYLSWDQDYPPGAGYGEGPTALIAAMRCYVMSELGDEIEVPDHICQ